jgi:acyl carrier protein
MNPTMTETIATLGKYVATHVLKQPNRVLKADQKLISSGMIDSFSLVDVQAYIEQEFGVWIDDPDMTVANCDTLQQIAGLIQARLT